MYKNGNNSNWSRHIDFIAIDILCLHLSTLLAYALRLGFGNVYADSRYKNMIFVLTFIDVCVIIFLDTMENVLKRGYYKEFTKTMVQVFVVFSCGSLYLVMTQTAYEFSRIVFALAVIFYLYISFCVRIWWKTVVFRSRFTREAKSLIVVTTFAKLDLLVQQIHLLQKYSAENNDLKIVVIDRDMVGQAAGEFKVVANVHNVIEYVLQNWVDEIFINLPMSNSLTKELLESFSNMGIAVHIEVEGLIVVKNRKQFVEDIGGYTLLTTSINRVSSKEIFLKRVLDVVGGIVGCLITGIIYIVVAPIIYIASPGPIFFSQIRIGENGKKFKCYKFRSMYMDAEERKKDLLSQNKIKDGLIFKLDYDPRIIGSKILPNGKRKKGIGNIIREMSIDEFPQFWNVLKGDMSLVGTRPPTYDEWVKYKLHHRVRMATKPGITGMWQVNGRSNITDFEKIIELEKHYIVNWNIGMDIKILLKTVKIVFNRDGSS